MIELRAAYLPEEGYELSYVHVFQTGSQFIRLRRGNLTYFLPIESSARALGLVEEAMRRMDRGSFGTCSNCGKEIPEKRLEVEPWAKHCISCQELEEQGLLVERDDLDDSDDDEEAIGEGDESEDEDAGH